MEKKVVLILLFLHGVIWTAGQEDTKEAKAYNTKIEYFMKNSPVGCEYFPCQNGGTCIELEGGDYTCKCPNVHGGRNCDIALTTCTCKGATHCRTFDRANIDYPGKCRFLLSKYEGVQGISVHATRSPHPFNPNVVYIDGVDLKMGKYNVSIRVVEMTIKVKVNGISVELPYSMEGDFKFDIFYITSSSVRFVTPQGFRLEVNRYWYVKVVVPQVFTKKMSGLCGNMDGDATNDLVLKDGSFVGELENAGIKIGNSYVEDLDKTFKECQLDQPPKPVPCKVGTLIEGRLTCIYLQKDQAYDYLFKNCLNVFDPVILSRFYQVCMEDMILTCDVQAARDVVRVFATACNHNGIELAEWTGMVKEECRCPGLKQTCSRWSSGCIDTCQSILRPQPLYKPYGRCILESYNSLCVCPEDTVLHNGTCIPPSACGCVDAETGVVYPLNATWTNEDCSVERTCVSNGVYDSKVFNCSADKVCVAGVCKSCTADMCRQGECIELEEESFCLCKPGFQGNACDQPLPKVPALPTESSTCRCSIGQQCSTFDGAQLEYKGNCRYLLLSYTGKTPFSVHVSSVIRHNTFKLSYPQQIEFSYKKNVVVMKKNSFSGSAVVHVSINGVPIEVPYESSLNDLSIVHNGDAIEVRTEMGVSVSYDNQWRLKVVVDKRYAKKVTGVCGNYDSEEANDYKLASGGSVMELEEAASKVAESYVVNCPVDAAVSEPAEECEQPSTEKCRVILAKEGPFKTCLALMGKQQAGHYALNCIKGVESSCNDLFACESLENFAKSCQEVGSSVTGNWRETVSCPSGCPDPSMGRAIRTTACRATCSNQPCKVVPNVATDICICPAGQVLFNGTCILTKDCGCVDEKGSARQLKETWLSEECKVKKQCMEKGEVEVEAFTCPSKTKCAGHTCTSCTEGACKNEGECMDMTVDGDKICKCKYGFSGADCAVSCNDKMDLVIVVDNTQSQCIGDTTFDGETCDQWKKVLNYVSKIVTFLQIGSPDNNIALVKLSATPALIGRGFVSSSGLMELLGATKLAFNYDNANIAAALRFLKKSVFSKSFDRPSAPNHVLFVLNSWSSLNSQVSEELEALKFLGAKFTAVVTNEKVKQEAIMNLVSSSDSDSERNYFVVHSVRAIESTKKYVQTVFNLCAAGKSVTCECVGDGRCVTFDKLKMEYKGFCRFLMLNHQSDLGDIQVWLKNFNPYPTGYLAYPKSLEMVLNGQRILLERYIKSVGSLVSLWVDGIERSIPFSGPDFYVFYNGDSVEVSTAIGVTMALSKLYHAKVIVNPTFKNEVDGFCGNYDDNHINDLSVKGGTQVKVEGNVTLEGAGFMVGDSFADFTDPDAVDGQCSDRSEKPNCRIFPWQCKRLLSEKKAFAPCFKKYPDETRAYVAMCKEDMFDSCKTSQDTYCQNFAEFDRFCQSKGIQVEWRAYTKCQCTCPPDMICTVRSSACMPTCTDPNAAKTCLLPDVADSCMCPEGKVLNHQRCINPSQCGCLDTFGKERAIGESWTTDNCTRKHTCMLARSITTVDYSCSLATNCEEETCVGCKNPLDIVFLVDESGSVCSRDPKIKYDETGKIIGCDSWTYVLQAMANILKDLEIGPEETQVAVIKFSTTASLAWNLDAYKTKPTLLTAMSQLTYGRGYTNMAAALRVARTEIFHSQADRPYAQNIMIFITDGKVTIEEDELPREAFKAQMMDIRQVSIGITNSVDELNLMALCDPPHKLNSNYFIAKGFDEIESLRKKLQERLKICPDLNRYVCECWGDVYCKSFDGKYLDYPAVCKTSVSESSSLNYPFEISFSVHRSNSTKELSYVNYVEVKILGDVIRIQKISSRWTGPLVMTLNDEEIEVPFKNDKFSFDYSGEYLQLLTEYGLVVGFSDRSNFFIDLPKTLSFNVEGFCGNFDDNAENDVLLKNKKVPTDVLKPGVELGNSYLAFNESSIPECKATVLPFLECEDSQEHLCTTILSEVGPFARCVFLLGEMGSDIYFQQCIDNYKRTCNKQGICRSVQDFARHCRQKGWKEDVPSAWRETIKCSCSCDDPDMQCRALGPSCLNTCANQTASAECIGPPSYDVCVCKDASKVLRKGKCVDLTECGCTDKAGKDRNVGDNFLETDCTLNSTCSKANQIESFKFVCPESNQCYKNKCTPCEPKNPCLNEAECVVKLRSKFLCKCKAGFYGRYCERERKTAVCRLWPGVGISTYDQALLTYDGLNKYLLSAGVFDRKNFFVFAKNYRACVDGTDQVTRLRYVEFVYEDYRVHLEKDKDSPSAPVIAVVNGVSVSIPYKSPSFAINYVGDTVEIKSFFGLIVAFSASSTAMMQIPSMDAFTSNVKGVCGNNDGNVRNDYQTNFGVDATDSDTQAADIVNSYDDLVLYKEEDAGVFEEECGEELVLDMQRCGRKPDMCKLMKEAMGPFMWCLQQIDPSVVDHFVHTCQMNYKKSCRVEDSWRLEASVCESMRSFVWMCQGRTGWTDEDVAPEWREKLECPCIVDEEGKVCKEKTVSCAPTCSNPTAPIKCNLPATFYAPVCANKNHVLFQGECIEPKDCGCVDGEGRARKVGEKWITEDCREEHSCVAGPKVLKEDFQCVLPSYCNKGKCVGCGEAMGIVFLVQNVIKDCGKDWKYVMQFMVDMVKLMRIEKSKSAASVVFLSSSGRTAFSLDQYKDTPTLIKAIQELKCANADKTPTDLDLISSLNIIRDIFSDDRKRLPDHVVIITESTSFRNDHLINGEMYRLKVRGVSVVSVGVGDVSEEAVKALSSLPSLKDKNYHLLSTYIDLGPLRYSLQTHLHLCPDTKPARCACFGDVHCSTFDQLHLSYQGTCKLLLAGSSSVFQDFKVYMKGTKPLDNKSKTVVEFVEVVFKDNNIKLRMRELNKKSPVYAEVNGKIVGIPSTFPDFFFRLNGKYSELVTPFGLIVALSPEWKSYVEIPRTYSYYTNGFCGNYDDDVGTDRMTSKQEEVTADDPGKLIGDSYVVNSNDDSCLTEPAPAPACELKDKWCKYIKDSSGPFSGCVKAYNEEQLDWFEKECEFEFKRSCHKDAACDMLETFANFCRRDFDGVEVDDEWRDVVECKCSCLDPSSQACQREGPGCVDTCENIKANTANCTLPVAYDVCRCNQPDHVFFQGTCIDKKMCGCKDGRDQTMHEMGSSWLKEGCTEESYCEGNKVISRKAFKCPLNTVCHNKTCTACRPNPCMNMGKCTDVDEDRYVCQCPPNFHGIDCQSRYTDHTCVCQDGVLCRSFNGLDLNFLTNKKWLLSSNEKEGQKFKVYAKAYKKYVDEDGVAQDAYLRYIQVLIGDVKVHLEWDDVEMKLFSSISASVFQKNGAKRVQVPYQSADFNLEWKGRFLKLTTQSGLSVSVSSRGLAIIGIKADQSYDLSGFCGDKEEGKGRGEGVEGEGQTIGEAFVVPDDDYELVYDQGKKTKPVLDKDCEIETMGCRKFLPYPAFYDCLNRLDTKFVDGLMGRCESRLIETCDAAVMCSFIEDLAIRCAEVVGVKIIKDWRNETQCPCQAREDITCLPIGPSCINSCSKPSAVSSCKDDVILDSYACANPDHVLSPEGACVAKETCGCVDEDGGSRVLTEKWLSEDCSVSHECGKANNVSDLTHQCRGSSKCNRGFCIGCDKPLDVAFLIDESDSICQKDPTAIKGAFSITTCDNFKNVQTFVVDLIKYFDLSEVNVAMLKFADQAATVFALDNDFNKEKIVSLVLKTPYNGGSRNPAKALRRVRRKVFQGEKSGDRSMAANVIVMVMSRRATVPDYRLNHELHEARIDGVKVIWVGVTTGKEAAVEFMKKVAKADAVFGQETHVVGKFEELSVVEKALEDKLGLCGHKTATCACIGGESCYTFDNVPLTQHVNCPFTLAKLNSGDLNLEVALENSKSPKHQTQILRVYHGEHLVELINEHVTEKTIDIIVKVNNKEIELPFRISDIISIFYNGMTVQVDVKKEGLQAQMGALGYVAVTLSFRRQLDFNGFCGNYDGEAKNDYVTKEGKVVRANSNAGVFIGNSYITETDPIALCFLNLQNFIIDEGCEDQLEKCRGISKLPAFKECEDLLGESLKGFHEESCRRAVILKCSGQEACEVVADFVSRCGKEGMSDDKLKGWRSSLDCPCKCSDEDKECKEGKSSACLTTCPAIGGSASGACEMGEAWDICRCKKEEQMLFKGRCVQEEQCGCISEQDGRSYELNTSWLNQDCTTKVSCLKDRRLKEESHVCSHNRQCHERKCHFCKPVSPCENGECIESEEDYYCKCHNGFFGKNCQKKNDVSVCWCWLGTDCLTFDGALWSAVNGLSRFLLASSTNAKCPFKVSLKNYRPCNEPIAVVRYVEIEFSNEVFRFEKLDPTSTTSKITAYVSGSPVALPLITEQYYVTYEGDGIHFESYCGLEVIFTGPPVQVKVPTYLSAKVTGLCGNLDNDLSNDLSNDLRNDLPPSQSSFNVSDPQIHEPEKHYDFLYDECPPDDFEFCNKYNKSCEKIKDNKFFSTCLKLLEEKVVEGFYKSCLATARKACATKLPVDDVLCEVQREFASTCKYYLGFETDVTPLFHADDQCACSKLDKDSKMKCQKNTNPCQNSCQEPRAESTCMSTETVQNVMKCSNPSHLLFKGECIEASECGCVDDNGGAREIGETWLDERCGTLNKCTAPNQVITEHHNCTTSETCSNSFCLGCEQAKDIVVLLQSSATVCQNDPSLNTAIGHCDRWKQLLRLVNDVLSPLDLSQSAVALVSYADDANVEFDFQRINKQKDLKEAMRGLKISEQTGSNLNKALIQLEKILDSKKERRHISKHVIIVSTSAYSGDEEDKAGVSMRLDRLKLIGTNLVSLGVVFDLPLQESMVRSYASAPNEKNINFFYMESFSDQFKVRSGIEENLHICDTKPARCACFGDVHCSTFDQLHLSYQGTCKLLLAEYPNSDLPEKTPDSDGLPTFSIALKGSNLFGYKTVTWMDSIEIKVFERTIVLRKEKATVAGPALAYVDSIKVAVPSDFKDFHFRYHGDETQVVTSFGLIVGMMRSWRMYIEVPRSYAFSTHGFCGNFDGNKMNDRSLSNGTEYTIRKNMGLKIGDSFIVTEEGEEISDQCYDRPNVDTPDNLCFLKPDKCDSMSKEEGMFGKCYKLFKEQKPKKAESYSKDCLLDLLTMCKEGSQCHVMEEYVDECRSLAGGESMVPSDWRIKMQCSCNCNDEDQVCANVTSACVNTCTQPEVSQTCEMPQVVDACVCKDAEKVVFEGRCVAKQDCGCYDASDGTEHRVNSTWISRDCAQVSKCEETDKITRQSFNCPNGTSCYINNCTACQPNPCMNGGVCRDAEDNRFKCKCTRGFSGQRCEQELTILTCKCVKGSLCETFDGYELLNNNVAKWTLFKAKRVKISDGVSLDVSSGSSLTGAIVFSEVEVRARNVEDCSSGEVWIQYLEVLIGGYVIRLERILGASVAPARVTVNEREVSIPYKSPSQVYTNSTYQTNNNKNSNNNLPSIFEITFYGSYVSITTQFGLKVEFNSLGVATISTFIDAENLSGSVNIDGFCGNNDGVLRNDVLIGGKSAVMVDEEEYDWEVGNLLAEHYVIGVGDEILGNCTTPYKSDKKECEGESPCEEIMKFDGVFADCVWSLDQHLVAYLYQKCLKSWTRTCNPLDTCTLFEDLAAICSTKVSVSSYKTWRQETTCFCSTGLEELSCSDWGSPCQKNWQTNPLLCLDTPTYDVIFCNSVSRLPGPCGPRDCIDRYGSARLFGETWLSVDCQFIFTCTDQGIIFTDHYQCHDLTKCSHAFCYGCDSPKDVLLVIDESSGICGDLPTCEEWEAILVMITDVIKMVDISKNKTRVGLIKFADEARVVFDLGQFFTKMSLLDSIMSLKSVGGVSNIGNALHVAREQIFEKAKCTGKRDLVPSVLVLITNGNKLGHDEDYHVINHEIFNLRLLNVRTIVLGMTYETKYVEMFPLLSARPHKEDWDYFLVRDMAEVERIERPFTDSISHCEFQTSTCSCVGNFHCTTFDHAHLSYTSQCPFLLTELDLLGHPMRVVVTNELDIEGVMSKQLVEVEWNEKKFRMENDYQNYLPLTRVFVEDIKVEIPYERANISLQYSGMNAELVLGSEAQVALVGVGPQGHVYVTVPYKLQLKVKGFCGNYDNNDNNDYVTATNEDVLLIEDPGSLIGPSYALKKDLSECESILEYTPCHKGVEKCKQITGDSDAIKFHLNQCNDKLPTKTVDFFYRACIKSYGEKCLNDVACKVISTYVDECRLVGVDEGILAGWKQIFNCPCGCDNNDMVCVANAKSCVKTCPNPSSVTFSIIKTTQESRKSNDTCKLPATRDVCECSKAGQMLFKGRCVQEDQCGCVSEQDGRSYELNASWLSSDCTNTFSCLPTHKISKVTFKCPDNMQCNEGVCSVCYPKSPCENYGKCEELGKGDYKCVCRASYRGKNCEIETESCLLHGNGHTNTFDWAALHFRSTCKLLLVSSKTPLDVAYQVYTKYEKRFNFYSILYVEVVYAGHVVRLLRREVDGKDLLVATINGIQVNNLPVKEKYFTLFFGNRKIVYEAKFGLVVTLTRSWVAEVALTSEAKNVVGYCGNLDGDIENDFLTKKRDDVTDDKDPGGKIGLSFVVEDDPEKNVGEKCDSEGPEELKDIPKEATKICSVIGQSECAQRLKEFQVKQFVGDCVMDYAGGCGVRGHQVYCQNIEAFAELCQGMGYPLLNWMADSQCACKCISTDQQCISSQISSSCVPTCGQANAQETCTAPDAYDVCGCGPSQVLHNGKCISALMCDCVDDKGLDRKIGETWYDEECTTKFWCSGPGSVSTEKATSCPATCQL